MAALISSNNTGHARVWQRYALSECLCYYYGSLVVGQVLKIKTGFRGFETERTLGFCVLDTDMAIN